VRRKVVITVRLVLRRIEVRFMEVMVVWLQVMPVNEHGLLFGSQLWRSDGLGRDCLKLRSCEVGSVCTGEEEEEREGAKWRRKRERRSKRVLVIYGGFMLELRI
jgi:hypothetical protein